MRGGEEGGVGPSFVNRADLADTASGRWAQQRMAAAYASNESEPLPRRWAAVESAATVGEVWRERAARDMRSEARSMAPAHVNAVTRASRTMVGLEPVKTARPVES